MDFLDPKKKQQHKIKLYIGYGLVGIAIWFASIVLVFMAYGYDIDRSTGVVIQNGLVILDAHPESATIFVDGIDKGTTSNRLVLPEDDYDIELKRDGYTSWKRTINLPGGSIEQLVYPYLFPTILKSTPLQNYNGKPYMASSSPDRKWLVVELPDVAGSFQVVDLSSDKHPVTTIALPPDTLTPTKGPQSFKAIEWSTDNNKLLLKHTFKEGVDFILLSRDSPADSLNINKLLPDHKFDSVTLRDKKPDQLYIHNSADGNLKSVDINSKSVVQIVSGVVAYKAYEADTILYVTRPINTSEAEVRVIQKTQDYLVRNVPISKNYLLDMAKFNNNFYLVVGNATDNRTYVYKDPFKDLTANPSRQPRSFRVMIMPKTEYVSFSAIARFIAVQGGSSFIVYDIETGRQFRYDTKLELATGQKAVWMDGHRIILNSRNNVQVFDFDGTNPRQLSLSSDAYTPFFDRDYTALFTLAPTPTKPDKITLTRTELKVLPEKN